MTETEIDLPANLDTSDAVEVLEEAGKVDDPAVVEADEYASLQDKVSEVRGVLEEALADRTDLNDETIDALGFEALCNEFEGDNGNLRVEALTQTPESGEDGSGSAEALSEDADKEKAEALYSDYQTFGNERLEDDIVEALGVSDFGEAQEVLD